MLCSAVLDQSVRTDRPVTCHLCIHGGPEKTREGRERVVRRGNNVSEPPLESRKAVKQTFMAMKVAAIKFIRKSIGFSVRILLR